MANSAAARKQIASDLLEPLSPAAEPGLLKEETPVSCFITPAYGRQASPASRPLLLLPFYALAGRDAVEVEAWRHALSAAAVCALKGFGCRC